MLRGGQTCLVTGAPEGIALRLREQGAGVAVGNQAMHGGTGCNPTGFAQADIPDIDTVGGYNSGHCSFGPEGFMNSAGIRGGMTR